MMIGQMTVKRFNNCDHVFNSGLVGALLLDLSGSTVAVLMSFFDVVGALFLAFVPQGA